MFCWSDYDLSVFYCIFGGGGERHIWMVPCADTATVTISEASIETTATLHYGIGKANNRNDKIERWTRRRTPHFPSLISPVRRSVPVDSAIESVGGGGAATSPPPPPSIPDIP